MPAPRAIEQLRGGSESPTIGRSGRLRVRSNAPQPHKRQRQIEVRRPRYMEPEGSGLLRLRIDDQGRASHVDGWHGLRNQLSFDASPGQSEHQTSIAASYAPPPGVPVSTPQRISWNNRGGTKNVPLGDLGRISGVERIVRGVIAVREDRRRL